MLNKYLDVNPEVALALQEGKPVVALESTIISHGMPYPQNVETALMCERTAREFGAEPATVAVIGGRLCAGLTEDQIDYLGRAGQKVTKASRRDLPVLAARGQDGATTVAATMIVAAMAGIRIFATGGIGGVHRGAETTMDISADLEELAQTPVMVVCAGAKSILDLGLTLEYLETKGVPVIGYGTEELPAFYTRKSGFGVDYRVDSPEELAQTPVMVVCAGAKSILDLGLTLEYLETKGVPVIGYGTEELPAFYTRQSGFGVDYRVDSPAELAAMFRAQRALDYRGGMLVTNPIPERYAMPKAVIDAAIEQALAECEAQGVRGKETTPFLLARVVELTGGESLESNIRLVLNNAALAAKTACELAR